MTIMFAEALERAMRESGYQIIGQINYRITNRAQRFQDATRRKGKDIFVFLHGERGATFGDWHDKENCVTWWMHKERTYPITREQVYERAMRRIALEQEQERKKQNATRRAIHFWTEQPVLLAPGENPINHPYVKRKQINPYFSKYIRHKRWIRDVLLLPIRNIEYNLRSLQVIKADGFKRFWKGAPFKDNMVWLHHPLPLNYKGIIYVCEGYATGCTIYQASGHPTICALNASNLLSVAMQLKRKYPQASIKICADNDFMSKRNIGLEVGMEAANRLGVGLHYPVFTHITDWGKPSDFNDLYVLTDIESVKKQLLIMRPTK